MEQELVNKLDDLFSQANRTLRELFDKNVDIDVFLVTVERKVLQGIELRGLFFTAKKPLVPNKED